MRLGRKGLLSLGRKGLTGMHLILLSSKNDGYKDWETDSEQCSFKLYVKQLASFLLKINDQDQLPQSLNGFHTGALNPDIYAKSVWKA